MICKHQTLPKGQYCCFCGEILVEVCELFVSDVPCIPRCKMCKNWLPKTTEFCNHCLCWSQHKGPECPCECHKKEKEECPDCGGETWLCLCKAHRRWVEIRKKEETDDRLSSAIKTTLKQEIMNYLKTL